ncbi:hypothetical protein L1889_17490 [Paenalcaligenes niemegkensis]|uniref:hypothetical protein n=1 Tax=Paenalcaligenes niemegkensis TaxID=2895469 RepID=UPI001EE84DFC|nr:hypothetical protein [Paenalcaligenes niemegkensis]MCQ9618249.1 hypothetical protein [Paenalcaligenes niemegkensis]
MTKKTLHIASCDKFIPPFIEFVKENFNSFEHEFLLTNGMAERELKRDKNIYLSKISILGKLIFYAKVIIKSHQAKKLFCMAYLIRSL